MIPAARGGATSVTNAQGFCQACNYAKEAPNWRGGPADAVGEIRITTPTGHTYRHAPPAPPGVIRTALRSEVEQQLRALLAAA